VDPPAYFPPRRQPAAPGELYSSLEFPASAGKPLRLSGQRSLETQEKQEKQEKLEKLEK